MSEQSGHPSQVRVLHRISSYVRGTMVTVDEGVLEAAFLRDFLGEMAYTQALADGDLVVIRQGGA